MTATAAAAATRVPTDMAARARELRRLVGRAVARHPAEAILLSGGLDTSILAPLAARHGTRLAVTVLVGPDAPDAPYAAQVAREVGLEHRVVRTDLPELAERAGFIVRTLVTFDPMEIRNSVVVALGLQEVSRTGLGSALTGDAADELFAGYSYMWPKPEDELRRYSEHLARVMRFSSTPLGRALGVRVEAPYADPEVVGFALGLPKSDKVADRGGVTWGKYLLRLAFPEAAACWRRKDPIEVGSGSTRLPAYFADRIGPGEFAAEAARIREEDRVEIRDEEHLAYYRLFRRAFGGDPPLARFGPRACAHCGFDLPTDDATFCVTCGAYPAR